MRIIKLQQPLLLSPQWDREYFGDEKTKVEEWREAIIQKASEIGWFEVDEEGEYYLNKLDRSAADAVKTGRATQKEADDFKFMVLNRIIESHITFIVMWDKRSVPMDVEKCRKINVVDVIAGWMRSENEMTKARKKNA